MSCMSSASRLAVFLEGELAVVLAEEIQEALVLPRFHVEEAQDDLVVAARLFEALVHEIAHVALRDLAVHVERIHRAPERLAFVDELLEQIVGDRAPALAPWL